MPPRHAAVDRFGDRPPVDVQLQAVGVSVVQIVHVTPRVERIEQRQERQMPDREVQPAIPGERAVPAVMTDAVQTPSAQPGDSDERHDQIPPIQHGNRDDGPDVQRPAHRESGESARHRRLHVLTRNRRGQPLTLERAAFRHEFDEPGIRIDGSGGSCHASALKPQFPREVVREIVDRSVIEQDSGRQSALDDLLERARNLNGGTRIETISIERLGGVHLRLGALDPVRQVGDQPRTQRVVGQRSVDGVTSLPSEHFFSLPGIGCVASGR